MNAIGRDARQQNDSARRADAGEARRGREGCAARASLRASERWACRRARLTSECLALGAIPSRQESALMAKARKYPHADPPRTRRATTRNISNINCITLHERLSA